MYDWRKGMFDLMTAQGRNPKSLSKESGMGETFVRDVLAGKNPRVNNLMKIASTLGKSVTELLEGTPAAVLQIPVVGQTSKADEWSEIDITADVALKVEGQPVAIRIHGNSTPPYQDGDVLIGVKRSGQYAHNLIGLECIVMTKGGERHLRFLARGTARGRFNLRSHNPSEKDVENVDVEWAAPIAWIKRGPDV